VVSQRRDQVFAAPKVIEVIVRDVSAARDAR
jgi:hypothetical protein